MSTNFWDVKPPEDDEKAKKHDGVELAETPDIEQSDKIHFPNPLKIQIDGQERDFFIENQAKLSSELINAIRSSNEFWIVDIDTDRNAFFQMHIESGLIEYWTDGAMQSQQTGDIDDALKHLESILITGSFSQIAKVELDDNPISSSTEIVPTQQRIDAMQQIDVAQLESVETPEIHKFFNNAEFVIGTMIVIFVAITSSVVLVENTILSFVLPSIAFLLLSAYLYLTRTRIVHFKDQQTYVWYQGNSVLFIYVKEMTDKLLTWTTTSTSTDSDGHKTTTQHHYFRIVDANGGELFSGEGAGGKAGWGRDKLITLLGLETINSRYKPPSTKHSVTGNTRRDLDNKENMQTSMKGIFALILVPILFFGTIAIFIIVGIFVGMQNEFGTYYDEDYSDVVYYCSNDGADYAYQMGGELCPEGYGITPDCPNGEPCICIDVDYDCFDGDDDWGYIIDFQYGSTDRWCNNAENYPVTTPIEIVSVTEIGGNEENRAMWPNNDLSYAINGGVCDYVYHSGQSTSFEFVFNLVNTSDIDGISILYIDDEWYTSGYSGIEIYTAGVNNTEWIKQYSSEKMYGEYERFATYEEPAVDFGVTAWYRHAFNETVTNVSQVKIVTGVADQMSDTSVSFTGLRVDAAGDYNYSDYFLCNGTWDGQFENSTSELILWDDLPRPYHLGCTDMVAQEE